MARKLSRFLALALLSTPIVAQDNVQGAGAQAAAGVMVAIQEAQVAEAALPPAQTVREKLERLGALDQAGRARIHEIKWADLSPEEGIEARRAIAAALDPIDAANMVELRKLLPEQGWFSYAEYGKSAAEAAFHILQHSDDTETKRRVLPHLRELAERGEIDGFDYAAMFDRIETSEGRPQRYGTQFRCIDGKMELFPLEDASSVERFREGLRFATTFAEEQHSIVGRVCR